MLWTQFSLMALAHLLAVMSPGPDFLMTVRQSVQHGLRVGVWTAIGIGCGIAVHVAYSLLGLAALIRSDATIFLIARSLGAAYLLWLALQCLRSQGLAPVGDTPQTGDAPRRRRAWVTGFMTNALNPKATLFFFTLFTTVIAAETPLPVLLGYGIWMIVITALWFCLVAWVMVQPAIRSRFLRAGVWFDRLLGVLLILLALRLLLN